MSSNICPQCGAPADVDASFCKYCNSRLATDSRKEQQTIQSQIPQTTHPQVDHVDNARSNQDIKPVKSRVVAGILALILGGFGIHKFYLGKPIQGIIYLLFFWTYIPGIIGFIEGIVYLCSDDINFAKKYGAKVA